MTLFLCAATIASLEQFLRPSDLPTWQNILFVPFWVIVVFFCGAFLLIFKINRFYFGTMACYFLYKIATYW